MTSSPSGGQAVCVCVANQAYLDYVRRVFQSLRRSGWSDDLLLITDTNNPPETLTWFHTHKITVWELPLLIEEQDWWAHQAAGHNPITLHKLYLFTERMKQWRHVVFLDADIILNRSIERLSAVDGFHACDDLFHSLGEQIKDPNDISLLSEAGYDVSGPSFNTGVMAFSTDILDADVEKRLYDLTRRFFGHSRWGEQLIVNLLWYRRWKALPVGYNFFPAWMKSPGDVSGLAFVWHYPDKERPWNPASPHHERWQRSGEDGAPARRVLPAALVEWYWRLCPRGLALTPAGRRLRAWFRDRTGKAGNPS